MNLNLMDPKLIMLAGVVILVIAIVVWLYVQRRRSMTTGLRQKLGPEYERAALKHGSERKAEAKLVDRERRGEKLNIRDLDPMEYERSRRWDPLQSRFVDSPKGAVAEADDLVSALMKARGYPVSDFDQRRKPMSDQVTNKAVAEESQARVVEVALPSSTSSSNTLLRRIAILLFILVAGLLTVFGYYASSICITVILAGFLASLFDPRAASRLEGKEARTLTPSTGETASTHRRNCFHAQLCA
jgi:hypothetical protein